MIYTLRYESANGTIEFSLKSGVVLERVQSLDEQEVAFSTADTGSQLGDVVESQRVRGKTMRFSGTIIGDSKLLRKQLLHVIAPLQRASIVFNGTHVMTVYPKNTPTIDRYSSNPKFSFSLYAPYPFWELTAWQSSLLVGLVRNFSFPFNPYQPNPFRFSTYSKAAYVIARNEGETPVPWKVHMLAVHEATNPYVSNFATGQIIKLWRKLSPGESAVIDFTGDELTVTVYDADGNAEDAFMDLDIDSETFLLQPGDNYITSGADEEHAVLRSQLMWRPAISGV